MMRVAGVDGGGTRTRCLIADESGNVLGQGEAGPANCATLLLAEVAAAVTTAVEAACRTAGCHPSELDAICAGLAGFYPPWHMAALTQTLLNTQHSALFLLPDLVIAWAGGLALRPGVVLVAGTGSVAYGRNAKGDVARAGGWGYLAGDEGSAYWIGREALTRLARTLDGRADATALAELLPARFSNGYSTAEEWLRAVYRERWSPGQVAALAPVVIEAAAQGDIAAEAILAAAGRHLAGLACHVLHKLGLAETEAAVVGAGGLLERPGLVRDSVAAGLQREVPRSLLRPARLPPVAGALLLALERCGVAIGEEAVERLGRGLC